MPRFSANLGLLWADRPLIDRIAAAAGAGFKAAELHFPYDTSAAEVRAATRRHGLKLLSINTDIEPGEGGHRGLGALAGREREFRALFDRALAWCSEAGGTAIHVLAGTVPEEERAAGAEVLVRNLAWAAPRAADHGLTLLIEPLNRRDNPGYFYATVEPAIEIIRKVGAPNLKLLFDVYHIAISQGDVLTRLAAHIGDIGHVQIAAVPSRAEPDEGEIAYRAIFQALDEMGYEGWVGCEYRPRTTVEAGLGWTKALGVELQAAASSA
jgi:hydroxypyruvate isomerase